MKRTHVLLVPIILLFLNSATVLSNLPAVNNYVLSFKLHLKENIVIASAQMTLTNSSDEAVSDLPVLLYRLFTVRSVKATNGAPLQFTQTIRAFSDEPTFQVNTITIHLAEPLLPSQSVMITMNYDGYMFGYPEVMAYVRDRVDEEYSLLRSDPIAYPIIAQPSYKSYIEASDAPFSYSCGVSVPKGYTVACGGELRTTTIHGDTATFMFKSKIPTWRIDIAAAKFCILKDEQQQLNIYVQQKDSAGAARVLQAMRDVIRLYSTLFGPVANYQGYTAIEIPDGWGSQAGDYYFLQTAAAFTDSTKLNEVYHEIGHTWNVKPKPEIQRCRYFDEAFASYFEALAVKQFQGDEAFRAHVEKYRFTFKRWAEYDKKYFETPIADYGKHELGRLSYTKGALSQYVLNQVMGDSTFNAFIRRMLSEFANKEIDFSEFKNVAERSANHPLAKFFDEWIYSSESSGLLLDTLSLEKIADRYK